MEVFILFKFLEAFFDNSIQQANLSNSNKTPLSKKKNSLSIQKNIFPHHDKVFHSEFGFGYVTSTDNEIVEVFFEDNLKKIIVNQGTLKRF